MAPWKRTYWVVWLANLVTSIGMMSFLPFFPAHLADIGVAREDIPLWTGLIFGAAPLVASLMTPIWSALGDRYGRRLMTVRAMLAITIFVGSMAFATEAWHLLLLRLGQGCFSGFIAPSITLVSVVAPKDRQGYVAGSLQTALALGSVIGPLLGGSLVVTQGLETVFVGVACASFVAACLVWFLARENSSDRQKVAKGVTPLQVLRSSLADLMIVWRLPRLRDSLEIVFWMILGMGASNPLLLLFVVELGAEEARAEFLSGLLFSCAAGVNLVAMPLWGKYGDRVGHFSALKLCSVLVMVAMLLHAVTVNIAMLFVLRVLLAAAMAGSSPLAYGLAAQEVPVERRGGAMGAVFSSRTLAVSISAMLGGFATQYIGIRGLFLVGGLVLLAALWRLQRRVPVEETGTAT